MKPTYRTEEAKNDVLVDGQAHRLVRDFPIIINFTNIVDDERVSGECISTELHIFNFEAFCFDVRVLQLVQAILLDQCLGAL